MECTNYQFPAEYVALMAYNAWEIWKARNRVCMEGKRSLVQDTIRKAYTQWMEFMANRNTVSETAPQRDQETKWKAPPDGKLKLNSDVVAREEGKAGYGFTLRDSHGRNILAGKKEEEAAGSSLLLEGLAMRYAMQMVKLYGLTEDNIESDCRLLIDVINGKGLPEPCILCSYYKRYP